MLLDDIQTFLYANGLTSTVHRGTLLELPDTAVAIRETGGFPTEHIMTSAPGQAVLDQPTVQVLARAADYFTASRTARSAYALLDGARDYVSGGEKKFNLIRAMQPPFLLERDLSHRYVFAFNIHIQRQSSVA